jgi:predicted RNase H-like nuclease (RuvC/YqgF family)
MNFVFKKKKPIEKQPAKNLPFCESRVANRESQISNLKSQISNLESQISHLASRIPHLKSRISPYFLFDKKTIKSTISACFISRVKVA